MSRPRLSLARRAERNGLLSHFVPHLVHWLQWLPAAIDKVHLEWALREIDPMHPDVQYIVHRLRDLESERA